MTAHKCIIKQGQSTGQIATGRTVTLSWVAKADVLIVMQSADTEEQCRLSQLRLAWLWATDQAKSGIGGYDTKEDCYWQFKVKYLAPALAAHDAEFATLWDGLGAIALLGGDKLYRQMSDRFISHADCTVAQVAEALTEWDKALAAEGHSLPRPEDYRFAMRIDELEKEAQRHG